MSPLIGGFLFDILTHMKLLVEKLNSEATMPSFSYRGDAGANIFSVEELVLDPGEKAAVKTGLKLAIPAGYAGFVWDKSGLAVKNADRAEMDEAAIVFGAPVSEFMREQGVHGYTGRFVRAFLAP